MKNNWGIKNVNTRALRVDKLWNSVVCSRICECSRTVPFRAERENWQVAELLLVKIGEILKFFEIWKAKRKFLSTPTTSNVTCKIWLSSVCVLVLNFLLENFSYTDSIKACTKFQHQEPVYRCLADYIGSSRSEQYHYWRCAKWLHWGKYKQCSRLF